MADPTVKRPGPWAGWLDALAFRLPVDVILPVYRDVDLTRKALDALMQSEPVGRFRLILINDCSPEAEMAGMLRDFCQQCPHPVRLLEHTENRGFTASVNVGMRLSRMRNVVLLNADALVSPGWLERLNAQARANPAIATLTPLSNNATIASFPRFCENNPLPEGWTRQALDALCARELKGCSVEIPTAVGYCMWIRRRALRELGLFDERNFPRGYGEENDFSRRAAKVGWQNHLACDVFVEHVGGVSFAEAAAALQQAHGQRLLQLHPEYEQVVQQHIAEDPAARYRQRLLQAMATGRAGL